MSGFYRLLVPGRAAIEIASVAQLQEQLSALQSVLDGQIIALEKGDRDYIKGKAVEGLWEVWRRRGGWWSKQSFSAWLSTDWSERASQTKFSLRRLFDSRDQLLLSNAQMIALFTAHFAGTKYPLGYVGAAG